MGQSSKVAARPGCCDWWLFTRGDECTEATGSTGASGMSTWDHCVATTSHWQCFKSFTSQLNILSEKNIKHQVWSLPIFYSLCIGAVVKCNREIRRSHSVLVNSVSAIRITLLNALVSAHSKSTQPTFRNSYQNTNLFWPQNIQSYMCAKTTIVTSHVQISSVFLFVVCSRYISELVFLADSADAHAQ